MIAFHPSRRAMLALVTAAGSASVAAFFWTRGPDLLIEKILRRQLPGLRTSVTSMTALSRDIQVARFQTFGRSFALKGGAVAASIFGVDALAQIKLTSTQFAQLERKVLTFFILGSDFLDVRDPKSDLVTYRTAPSTCPNRFAEYD